MSGTESRYSSKPLQAAMACCRVGARVLPYFSMRIFEDEQGVRWEAALLQGSYGHILLLFSPMQGTEVRQILMDANYMAEAGERLAALSDDKLRGLLGDARPWDGGKIFAQTLDDATR